MQLDDLRARLGEVCGQNLGAEGASLLTSLARPAVTLCHAESASSSHLGGVARLDPGEEWPLNGRGEPLALLCVLDLADLAGFETDLQLLPTAGVLNFFYDYEEQPWGFRPSDRSGWRVIWADPLQLFPSRPPSGTTAFVSIGLEGTQTLTLPGWEEDAVAPLFPPHSDRSSSAERARERYRAVQDEWSASAGSGASPSHQVGGWPSLQQAPIWRECDLVSRGHPLGTAEEGKAAEHHPQFLQAANLRRQPLLRGRVQNRQIPARLPRPVRHDRRRPRLDAGSSPGQLTPPALHPRLHRTHHMGAAVSSTEANPAA